MLDRIFDAEITNPWLSFQKANPEKAKQADIITAIKVHTPVGPHLAQGADLEVALHTYWLKNLHWR